MLPLSDATFVITDIETTGLSPERDRMIEVACVELQGSEIVSEERTLINPERYIPQSIVQLTGISTAMVLGAPKESEILPTVRGWLGNDAVFTAHNITFDNNFLHTAFQRHGLSALTQPKLCTLRLARRVLPKHKGYSLGDLAVYFGIRVQGRHSALGDAQATAQLLIRLIELIQEEHDCETVDDLLGFQYKTMGAFKKTPQNVQSLAPVLSALPHRPGVYRMIDKHNEILYIGKAKDLRSRVGSYFRPGAEHTPKIVEMVKRVRRIETEETGSELGALLLESRLIKEHQPKYNTLQKRYRRYAFLRLTTQDDFPRTELALEVEPDGNEYFGPFSNRDAVGMVIDAIDRAFRLRECTDQLVPNENITPCFYHQIKRCDAPCARLQTIEQYRAEVAEVRMFLSGSEEGIISRLQAQMMEHAEKLEFEEAAVLRNRLYDLRRIFVRQQRITESINTNNVLILLPSVNPQQRELFMIRYGRLARHLVIGKRFPEKTVRHLVERIYFDGSGAPPHFRKPEIDEVKIIAGYLHQRKDEGTFVYVSAGDTVEDVVGRVAGRSVKESDMHTLADVE
jgi:DNA polymerase-3 subunit epsilon